MKRAVLSFLSAIAFVLLFAAPLGLLGMSNMFGDVLYASIPVLTLLVYYGHSRQALSQEQNELLRELLRGKQMQEEGEAGEEGDAGEAQK